MQETIISKSMLKVGTILHGTYRIDSYLSSGGFGNTYVATNVEFDERVAIKEFFMKGVTQRDEDQTTVNVSNSENSNSFGEQKEKFKKEARRLRKLHNEHIVSVHDLFEENGTAYYVMDFVDGENLSERLKRTGKPMSEQEVLDILPQVLDALKFVHDADIWHLDLKPANIMVDKKGKVKLIDFGASKQLNAQKGGATTSTAISYTNGYAPREQMEQNYDKFGPWTDFYALGATLYALLTLKHPPLPTDLDDDMSEDKHQALPMQTVLNQNLHDLILWLMKTNRNQRPKSIKEIENWLKQPETLHDSKKKIEGHSAKTDRTFNVGGSSVTLDELLEKAFEGDDESLDSLNQLFEDKSISNKEKEKVFLLVKKRAEQGNDEAILIIGNCFYSGEGVTINQTEAVRWYKLAAEHGNAVAECTLGSCYANGEGVPENKEEAVRWYRLAAEQGLPDAQYMIGTCYANGEGVLEDKVEAVRWYKLAAEQCYAYAQLLLGLCYLNGDGVTEDKAEAVRLFRIASEQDNEFAMLQIGLCYYNGIEVSENKTEAVKWFKKAAEKGESEAQYYLGCCYSKGEGVHENKEEAVRWYRLAAGQGVVDAQYELACCYKLGEGITENYDEAKRWFTIAAENGHEDAIDLLNSLQPLKKKISNDEETIIIEHNKGSEESIVKNQKVTHSICEETLHDINDKNPKKDHKEKNLASEAKKNQDSSYKAKKGHDLKLVFLLAFILISVCGYFIIFTKNGNKSIKKSDYIDVKSQNLIDRLITLRQRGYMFGHQDDSLYGLTWEFEKDSSDVKSVCGDYPAIMGFELGGVEIGEDHNIDNVPFTLIKDEIIKHYNRGGIITISWHCHNPLTYDINSKQAFPNGTAWDVSEKDVVKKIIKAGPEYDLFQTWILRLSNFLSSLKTAEGVSVPIIFRPWHENTGNWFWWGEKFCTTKEYKDLWNMLQDRLRANGLDNIVWAYSPAMATALNESKYLERYPGDDRVSIVGIDGYQWRTKEEYIAQLDASLTMLTKIAADRGKIPALTECGLKNLNDPTWWTSTLTPILDKHFISYFLVWRNFRDEWFGPSPINPDAVYFKEMYAKDNTLFLNDIN